MEKIVQKTTEQYIKERGRKKRWQKVVTAMAAVVVFCTTYALIMPAVTQQGQAFCGVEEHKEHTADCYETKQVLTCTLSEEGHEHSSECFIEQPVLSCDIPETDGHSHDASCFAEDGSLICEEIECEPHHHSDSCYTTEEICVCGLEEQPPHQHSEACYTTEETLVCELPIHEHSLQCFSDPEADLETASVWERNFKGIELSGNWSKDVIAIASTQIGYSESRQNYQVRDDGVTMNGYTRYGDWYGIPYGDWCAMFCSFCLNYANVDRAVLPWSAGCQSWVDMLSEPANDLYHNAAAYIPRPGDLIFFDWDKFDPEHPEKRKADHVGFVAELIFGEETNELIKIKTIEGNRGERVCNYSYSVDDEYILGYGELPENPNRIVEKHVAMENGVEVAVSAPVSSFPYSAEDVDLTAGLIMDSETEEVLKSCLKEEGVAYSDVMLINVCMMYQGTEIEPIGPVTLTFDTGSVINASAVYHVDEQNETVTDMNADVSGDGLTTIETDHFSVFALAEASAKKVSADINTVWDQAAGQFTSITVNATSPDLDKAYYSLSVNNGADWTVSASNSDWSTMTAINGTAEVPTALLSGAAPDTEYRVHGALSITQPWKNYGYSTSFTMVDLCEKEKAGFKDWLRDKYVQYFGGASQPKDLTELYGAFALYNSLPGLKVTGSVDNSQWILSASTDFAGTPTYKWEYYDETYESWITMPGETGAVLNTGNHAELNGGRDVRCSLYDGTTLKAITVIENVDSQRQLYDYVIEKINRELSLDKYPVLIGGNTVKDGTPSHSYRTMEADVSIHGENYDKFFYWKNVACADFTDGESYADYLVREFLKCDSEAAGLAKVSAIWDRYIYDIYDPLEDSGYKDDKSNKYLLNGNADGNHDYGDATITYVKDSTSTSFHGTQTYLPEIDPLNYDYLENGIDYKNFVSGLDKTATAVEAGDFNEERKYLIDITADVQAKATAPVAMILQIQTSWQMFDLAHANALTGDYVAVGAAAANTELANLYAIKQALLDFVDYMESEYPGNNLVLGITEVRHDTSQTMLLGTDEAGKPLYVSNNYDVLRNSILDWDTFGNCEHVHYTDSVLKAAVVNLASNLSEWTDQAGARIKYQDIRKIAVIIGGPTEKSNSKDGYGCALPWDSFQAAGLNSVYGIRANNGTPHAGVPVISWIDNDANNTGNVFADGQGTKFTDKYVASTREAMLNTLIDIAEREITTYGLDIIKPTAFIEGVTVDDTVTDEFMIDPAVPFTATVYNSSKYGDESERGKKANECIIDWQTGTVERVTYTGGVAKVPSETIQGNRVESVDPQTNIRTTTITFADADGSHTLTIVEKPQELGGTSDVTYDFDKVYNTKKCNLNFGIVAREDYIGSNNVFTNVGTPDLDYKHYKLDSNGNFILNPLTGERLFDNVSRICPDTPEVNVPIRFTTTDGETKVTLLNTTVDLGMDAELSSHVITHVVEDLVDNYDQINGTLQYAWVLPNGVRVACGSVEVDNGTVLGDFPSLDYDYVASALGKAECKLEVTFTPEAFQNNKNFNQDGITNVQVSEVMHPGKVWIEAVEADGKLGYYIRKEWAPKAPADITSVQFLLSDGHGGYVVENASGYGITADPNAATVFNLTDTENWECHITGLPVMKTVDGKLMKLSYQLEEHNIPDGYTVSYYSATKTDEEWQGHLRVTLSPTVKVSKNDAKFLHITFRYGGTSYDEDLPITLSADIPGNGTHTIDFTDILLPLDGRLTLSDIDILEIFTYKSVTDKGSYDRVNNSLMLNSTARAVAVMTGTVTVPVLVMKNSEGGQHLQLIKINQDGQPLPGAEFALYASDTDGNMLSVPMPEYEKLVSDADGEFTPTDNFSLPIGTYYLFETKIPDGFLTPETPVKLNITATGVSVEEGNTETVIQNDVVTVKVQNIAGYELPKTGGAGTNMFTVGGLLLMTSTLVCGLSLRRKRERRYTD